MGEREETDETGKGERLGGDSSRLVSCIAISIMLGASQRF